MPLTSNVLADIDAYHHFEWPKSMLDAMKSSMALSATDWPAGSLPVPPRALRGEILFCSIRQCLFASCLTSAKKASNVNQVFTAFSRFLIGREIS